MQDLHQVAPPHALVLTAGLGTRLEPLTSIRAKPAIPIAGTPLIRHIITRLVADGIINITLNLHHRPETVTAVVGDGSDLGARVRYSWELPRILGSAGGPRRALDIIAADRFFLINGDTISDVSLGAVAESHTRSGALVTLALVPNERYLQYGGVCLDSDGAVTGFVRRGPSARGSFHLFGIQMVERGVFAELAAGEPVSSVGGVYDRLIEQQPGAIRGYVTRARYWDIGTVDDYWRTSITWPSAPLPHVGARVRLAASARVSGSILWDDIQVGEDATLEECIVTDGVEVPARSTYRRVILVRAASGALAGVPFVP